MEVLRIINLRISNNNFHEYINKNKKRLQMQSIISFKKLIMVFIKTKKKVFSYYRKINIHKLYQHIISI